MFVGYVSYMYEYWVDVNEAVPIRLLVNEGQCLVIINKIVFVQKT